MLCTVFFLTVGPCSGGNEFKLFLEIGLVSKTLSTKIG